MNSPIIVNGDARMPFSQMPTQRNARRLLLMRMTSLLLFIGSVSLPGCDSFPSKGTSGELSENTVDIVAVETDIVYRTTIEASLECVGTLLPLRATIIAPEVDGVITSFPASDRAVHYLENGEIVTEYLGLDLGHEVKEGDVLVTLDDAGYQIALRSSEAQLELVTQQREELIAWRRAEEVAQLEAEMDRCEASEQRAAAELTRADTLLPQNAISPSAYDDIAMSHKNTEAAVKAAIAALELATAGPTPEQLAVADAQVAAAEAEVARRSRDVELTKIRAPYDAVVVERFVDVGMRVITMPSDPILQIMDPRLLFAEINIPEQHQNAIRYAACGDEPCVNLAAALAAEAVWITVDSLPKPIPGRIDLINGMVDPATRSLRVRVSIDNRDRVLRPGGFVKVRVPIATRSDALAVPKDAVLLQDGKRIVFVVRGETVEKVVVETGLSNDELYEIRSGVLEGDQIVVGGTAVLRDGMTIQVDGPTAVADSDPLDNSDSQI
jgi:HlyD family secretion protein